MGRGDKKKVYEYDKDGKFLCEYESHTEFCSKYYGKNRPLFQGKKEYAVTPKGTYISYYKIGRENLRRILRIENSKYVPHYELRREIECFNIAGEKIATFRSALMASRLTGIDRETIDSSCKSSPKIREKYSKSTELIFRYKS